MSKCLRVWKENEGLRRFSVPRLSLFSLSTLDLATFFQAFKRPFV